MADARFKLGMNKNRASAILLPQQKHDKFERGLIDTVHC